MNYIGIIAFEIHCKYPYKRGYLHYQTVVLAEQKNGIRYMHHHYIQTKMLCWRVKNIRLKRR